MTLQIYHQYAHPLSYRGLVASKDMIQMFRERLSVKAYAPMPNGFMGNTSYCCLVEVLLTMEGDRMCTYIHRFSSLWAKTP